MSEQNADPRPFDPPVPPAPLAPAAPPVPRYGEYAAIWDVPGVPPTSPVTPESASSEHAPLARKRRTWDTVLTIILLVLALFGMLAGVGYALIFSNQQLLSEAVSQAGYGDFSGSAGAAPAVLAISHIVLFLLALGLSIPLLARGRIVVFWIPLVIGVIAAVFFWGALVSVFASDPTFLSGLEG